MTVQSGWFVVCAIGLTAVACGGDAHGVRSGPDLGGAAGSNATGGTTTGGTTGDGGTATGGTSTGGAATGGSSTGGATTGGAATGGAGGAWVMPPDAGSGACPDFTPCGGDPTGTWTLGASCFDPPLRAYGVFCSDAQETLSIEGTLTFGADHSYTTNASLVTHAVLSAQCVTTLGGCGTGLTAGCTAGSGGTCVCDLTNPVTNASATWSVDGNTVIIDESDGTMAGAYFCQTNNQMMLRGLSSSGQIYVYTLTR